MEFRGSRRLSLAARTLMQKVITNLRAPKTHHERLAAASNWLVDMTLITRMAIVECTVSLCSVAHTWPVRPAGSILHLARFVSSSQEQVYNLHGSMPSLRLKQGT